MVENFRRQLAAGHLGEGLIALAWLCNENEIGIRHRDQRGDDAAADLAHIIILPSSRKRRERDEIANATPQLVKRLRPRHGFRLELCSPAARMNMIPFLRSWQRQNWAF